MKMERFFSIFGHSEKFKVYETEDGRWFLLRWQIPTEADTGHSLISLRKRQ